MPFDITYYTYIATLSSITNLVFCKFTPHCHLLFKIPTKGAQYRALQLNVLRFFFFYDKHGRVWQPMVKNCLLCLKITSKTFKVHFIQSQPIIITFQIQNAD